MNGELAAKDKDFPKTQAYLTHAIDLEDGLNYIEPKGWYLPPRQVLGAILLESGKYDPAEIVYREDLRRHPQNGWSLLILVQSLRAKQKNTKAKAIDKRFQEIWDDVDVELKSSRF